MKLFFPLILAATLLSGGCATTGTLGHMTSAQAIAIAQPLVSGGLTLVLDNNPGYIPIAKQVGADLTSANYNDLTVAGLNTAIAAICTKEKADPQLTAIVEASVDAGLAGYLEAVGESALANDPNAQAVLNDLGQAITTAATTAVPKA